MINLKKLIDLLPSYYKEKDTYKDGSNKGILERFLEVTGDYFGDNISPDIDNLINLIDIDTTGEIYLNYLWEFLGSIPYAYGSIRRGDLWDRYSETDFNRAVWLSGSFDNIPRARFRDVLKYAISLYKIRGTLDFYNILLGFYDLSCTISDPAGDFDSPQGTLVMEESSEIYHDDGHQYDDGATYDVGSQCHSCTNVEIKVVIPDKTPGLDTVNKTLDEAIAKRILLLLNRFRPINVVEFSLSNVAFGIVESNTFTYVLTMKLS